MNEPLRVTCFAKINLTLEILGKRSDGYHELRTVFQTVSLADTLHVSERPEGTELTVTGLPVPVAGNLCLRALEVFSQRVAPAGGVRLALDKHIPVGAGLGGGSSDAAGVLAALDRWRGPYSRPLLNLLAAQLGSDVAFFLYGGTALGQGRGEVLEPLPALTGDWLVIARPELHVSTAAAYQGLEPSDFTGGEHTAALAAALKRGCGLRESASHLYNSFERTVLRQYPAIAAVKARLRDTGAEAVLLSGSGAAVFGLCADEPTARQIAARLTREGVWAVAACTVAAGPVVQGVE